MDELVYKETATEVRSIEVITNEIIAYKQVAGASIVEIGNRLIEAKAQLDHGEWLPWLEEKVQFSEASAQRFMRLAKEWSNPSALTDLGSSKALSLLALPESEREDFIAEKHDVNGEEKTVYEMTSRELQQAISALKSKDKEIEALNENILGKAGEIERLNDLLKDLNDRIAELQNREPEKIVDLDAQEELKSQIEKLKKEKDSLTVAKDIAINAQKNAENALAKAKAEVAAGDKLQSENIKILEKQNEDLRKQLALASSSELTLFKVYFENAQKAANEMLACIDRADRGGDIESAESMKKAFAAFVNALPK